MNVVFGGRLLVLVRQFIDIALFRAKPQDLPAQQSVFLLATILSFVTYVLGSWPESGGLLAIQRALLDLAVTALFIYGGLQFQGKTERFRQSFSALAGAGAVINVIAVPIILSLGGEQLQGFGVIILLLLYGWTMAVCAHVFRYSFDLGPVGSAVSSVIYIITAIQISHLIFPYTQT